MMNILITGSNGQLGSEFRDLEGSYPKYRFFFTDINELDVTNVDKVNKYLRDNKIECVVNCAGFTQVDKAEDARAQAILLNSTATKNIAEATAILGAMMIHISTDYVFDGKNHKPYTENDTANPKSTYGKSKLDGEIEVMFNAKRAIIIRTSWLYSSHGHNFVKTILEKGKAENELRVVFDQIGTPTYARDLAKAIMSIIPKVPSKIRGEIYNFSNEGVASWYDFACAIAEIKGLKCKIVPVLSKDYQQAAQRPHYSVLNKSHIKKDFGIEIPYWRDSLKDCLAKL